VTRSLRTIATALVATVLSAAAMLVFSAGPAHAGYETCPYGKVCLYTGLFGGGARYDVPRCGWNDLPGGYAFRIHSVRTYGNAVDLFWLDQDGQGGDWRQVGHVNQWSQTNLDAFTADTTSAVNVIC
jgi:hypothetical protein